MPTESESLFESFPPGGALYRIHWMGQRHDPKHDSETPRVAVWLNKILLDKQGAYQPEKSWHEKDKLLLTMLDESAGSIPKLAIGTYWVDGQPAIPPFPLEKEEEFLLPAGQSWKMVTAGSAISSGSNRRWVGANEYPLFGWDIANRPQPLYNTLIVIGKTDRDVSLIFPTYEIFRSYFAGCSELAVHLLSEPLTGCQSKLINPDTTKFNDTGTFDIELAKSIPDIAVRYLALFFGTDYGRRAVMEIHTELHKQKGTLPANYKPWIAATPPFSDVPIKLGVVGKWLDADRFLVYRITKSAFPAIPFSIRQLIDKQYIPIDRDKSNPNDGEENVPERTRTHSTGLIVTPADDARDTQKSIRIDSIGVAWDQDTLPAIKKEPRERRFIPKPKQGEGESTGVNKQVSVGARSGNATVPRASMSSETIEQVVSRFDALHRCLDKLKDDGDITSWGDYPLVRPELVRDRTYCALMDAKELHRYQWATIHKPARRSRFVWVGEIQRDGHTVYWIEIESNGKNDPYSALVFTTLEKQLEPNTLHRLMNMCIHVKGKWPKYSSRGLQDVLRWERVVHIMSDNMLRPAYALGKIDLVIAKTTGDDNSTT